MCRIDPLFCILSAIESFYWSYIGFTVVIAAGLYFSFRSGFYQFKVLAHPIRTIKAVQKSSEGREGGISPFRVYFASVGGMVGLGNIVGVVTAVTLGGPGALFWLWIASFFGMLIKYAEIYLGMKFRIEDEQGYHGGPMIYLRKAFQTPILAKVIPIVYCSLLAIYGVEVYQFVVIMDVLTDVSSLSRPLILAGILAITLYGGFGGIRRLANISTALMPPFIVGYILLSLYIIAMHITILPSVLADVFRAAFTGNAAMGGFAGSSMLMAIQLGTARAVYSGDLGIGYDSIIQSESKAKDPATQACLSIFGVATDGIVCTMSILVVLVTGIWQAPVEACHAVSYAFTQFFPHVDIFMALLIFIAGYTTVIAYLTVGEKAMRWLFPQWGRRLYFIYAVCAFIAFSFLDQCHVMTVMSLSGGLLMLTNLLGIWKLRHEVVFKKELIER